MALTHAGADLRACIVSISEIQKLQDLHVCLVRYEQDSEEKISIGEVQTVGGVFAHAGWKRLRNWKTVPSGLRPPFALVQRSRIVVGSFSADVLDTTVNPGDVIVVGIIE